MLRSEEVERLREAVLKARARLAEQFTDVDPGDLVLILQSLLRPPGSGRRFFLRNLGPDQHVF